MRAILLLSLLFVPGCGSVEVPATRSYALRAEIASAPRLRHIAVLRVGRFDVDAHLSGDRLLVRSGAHALESYEYHSWAAPLSSLVTDAILGALLRRPGGADVVDLDERADAEYTLTGRVLAFEVVEDAGEASAWVRIAYALRSARDGTLVLRRCVEERVPCVAAKPEDVVRALDAGLATTLQDFLGLVDEEHGPGREGPRNADRGPRPIGTPPK